MKEYNIKLESFSDFLEFRRMVRKNHLTGKIVQRDLQEDIHATFSILLSLPLNSATLIINDSAEEFTPALDSGLISCS